MRTVATVLLVACGGSPPTPASNHAPITARPPAGAGTSGFESVSWGDPIAGVQPGPRVFEELPATVSFDGDPVREVRVRVDATYPTMELCGVVWTRLRARLDQRLGASQTDNLAAYWTTRTALVTAACNPDDAGVASLTIEFAPLPP